MKPLNLFDPRHGLIVVRVRITGPNGRVAAQLALDTGATDTTIRSAILTAIGYNVVDVAEHVSIIMGGSVVRAPVVPLMKLQALGQARESFSILAHTLPPGTTVDGVLGLDFMRGQKLTVDFRVGLLSLQ